MGWICWITTATVPVLCWFCTFIQLQKTFSIKVQSYGNKLEPKTQTSEYSKHLDSTIFFLHEVVGLAQLSLKGEVIIYFSDTGQTEGLQQGSAQDK